MNCSNCQIMKKDVPCIPQGNDFKIAIALKEIIKADGEVSERDIDIDENETLSVAVIKPNGDAVENPQNVFSFDLLEGTSTIILDFSNQEGANALPKGKYGIEVKGKRDDADSSDFCFKLPPGLAFEIVADSAHGYFPSDSIITYTVNGVVGVAQNVGEGGGGSGEANVIEVVKVNGTALQVNNKAVDIPVPDELKDLGGDSTHRTVTDAEKSTWNNKSDFSGDYDDLGNKPTIPSKTSDLTNDSGFITSSALNGYERMLQIVRNPSTTLTAEFGKYYRFGTVDSLVTITLPAVQDNNIGIEGFIVSITMSDAGLDISTQDDIMDVGLSDLEDGKTYELNFIWNGAYWAVTAIELTVYTPQSS